MIVISLLSDAVKGWQTATQNPGLQIRGFLIRRRMGSLLR
jgi:hypothetical protein